MTPEQLVDAINSVPFVECCDCGLPKSEHQWWEDKIYDVNGYHCPRTYNQEYRFNQPQSAERRRRAQIALALRSGSGQE